LPPPPPIDWATISSDWSPVVVMTALLVTVTSPAVPALPPDAPKSTRYHEDCPRPGS
jgi:hypothetical protein